MLQGRNSSRPSRSGVIGLSAMSSRATTKRSSRAATAPRPQPGPASPVHWQSQPQSSRSCSWAASGSAFRGVPTGNPAGLVDARARPPSGHVYGTGRLADRLTGRQAHCLRVGPQSREKTDCPGARRWAADQYFRRARSQLPALVARRKLELLFWARGAGRNGIYVVPQLGGRPRLDCDGASVAPLVLVAGRLR